MNKVLDYRASQGFSLIEVLVAVFVIAIGVLGVSSAQLISLKNSQSSYYRSQANFLVMDMLDRMRANPDGVQAGHYNDINTKNINGSTALPNCNGTADGCSVAEIAQADAAQWASFFSSENNVGLLPGSVGTVKTEITGTRTDITIEVTWSESNWKGKEKGFDDSIGRVAMTARL